MLAPGSCAASSDRTAPARARCSTCWPARCARPPAGSISPGRTSPGVRSNAFARLGIARKFQMPSVFPEHDACADNLGVAERRRLRQATAANGRRDAGDARRSSDSAALPAGALAHGQKQWLEIGMALMARAEAPAARRADRRHEVEETQRTARAAARPRWAHRHRRHRARHALSCARSPAARTVMHQGRIIADGAFAADRGRRARARRLSGAA